MSESGHKKQKGDTTATSGECVPFSSVATVFKNKDLLGVSIAQWLDLVSLFRLGLTCKRTREILGKHKTLRVARLANAETLNAEEMKKIRPWAHFRGLLIVKWVTVCAFEGDLVAYRYFFARLVRLRDQGLAKPERLDVELSFGSTKQEQKEMVDAYGSHIVVALEKASSVAAFNGHLHIILEVATFVRLSELPHKTFNDNNWARILQATLRMAARAGHLHIVKRVAHSSMWTARDEGGPGFLENIAQNTVNHELIRRGHLPQLEEWGFFLEKNKPDSVRWEAFLTDAIKGSSVAMFDRVFDMPRGDGSTFTLSGCVAACAGRGNKLMIQHVAKRMLAEEVRHIPDRKAKWAAAIGYMGKHEDVSSTSARHQERREECFTWVYRQGGHDRPEKEKQDVFVLTGFERDPNDWMLTYRINTEMMDYEDEAGDRSAIYAESHEERRIRQARGHISPEEYEAYAYLKQERYDKADRTGREILE